MAETTTDLQIEYLLSKLHTGGSDRDEIYPRGFYQSRGVIENIFGRDERGRKTMAEFRDFLKEVLKA